MTKTIISNVEIKQSGEHTFESANLSDIKEGNNLFYYDSRHKTMIPMVVHDINNTRDKFTNESGVWTTIEGFYKLI